MFAPSVTVMETLWPRSPVSLKQTTSSGGAVPASYTGVWSGAKPTDLQSSRACAGAASAKAPATQYGRSARATCVVDMLRKCPRLPQWPARAPVFGNLASRLTSCACRWIPVFASTRLR